MKARISSEGPKAQSHASSFCSSPLLLPSFARMNGDFVWFLSFADDLRPHAASQAIGKRSSRRCLKLEHLPTPRHAFRPCHTRSRHPISPEHADTAQSQCYLAISHHQHAPTPAHIEKQRVRCRRRKAWRPYIAPPRREASGMRVPSSPLVRRYPSVSQPENPPREFPAVGSAGQNLSAPHTNCSRTPIHKQHRGVLQCSPSRLRRILHHHRGFLRLSPST